MGVSSLPSSKTIYSFLVYFLLLLAIETLNVNDNMIHKVGQVSANIIIGCFDVGVSSSPGNKTISLFLLHFLLLLAIDTFNLNEDMVFSANTTAGCFDMGVSSSANNKIICSYLLHFLLLLATETLNVNDNMIYKWVRSVQIMRPFVHSLVHFLLLLATETFNVSENMTFKCVSFVQSLTLDVFMWACLPRQAVRHLFIFSTFPLISSY